MNNKILLGGGLTIAFALIGCSERPHLEVDLSATAEKALARQKRKPIELRSVLQGNSNGKPSICGYAGDPYRAGKISRAFAFIFSSYGLSLEPDLSEMKRVCPSIVVLEQPAAPS